MDAIRNIEDHQSYIELDSPSAAKKWTLKIFQQEEVIAEFPFLGRVIPEKKIDFLREKIVGNFRILYEIRDDLTVVILNVIRSTQNYTSD